MLNTTCPFISGSTKEIEIAFEIPEHVTCFSAINTYNIPVDAEMLTSYRIDDIKSTAMF